VHFNVTHPFEAINEHVAVQKIRASVGISLPNRQDLKCLTSRGLQVCFLEILKLPQEVQEIFRHNALLKIKSMFWHFFKRIFEKAVQ
jgi:hypothetical protein